ncbi:histidine phosphatase family protein [Sphingomonas sp. H39-1-10]|uniref:histidine phosphatase family protein n=1 Tax=Sphingomonas pollutisoli TaxID=3030829 RepID=UPI0023B8AACB|nr:histidine phosphatase family protein [Sphingomonas pollutisoli]MDF0486702.1 histidine phosphatase family protein [Sphingomonas pollutisoli]
MGLIVTIVRHGNTFETGEPPRRIGARTDLPLVASGQAQARALGAALPGFDRVLAAPLLRTRATVEAILATRADAPTIEDADWLTEIDHGPDEDAAEDAVLARIGHAALAAWDAEARVPGGWIVDAERRLAGWRDLWRQGAGRVLVVTSNGAARFALRSDESLRRQAEALPSLKLRTGAYGVIACDADGLRLIDWDRRP